MMKIVYSPTFVRRFQALPFALQEETVEKIELFKNQIHHRQLRVHKLSGRLNGRYSFSINYRARIIFRYLNTHPREAFFLTIGDHDVYQ